MTTTAKTLLIGALATIPAGTWIGGSWWKWALTAAVLVIAAAIADIQDDPVDEGKDAHR